MMRVTAVLFALIAQALLGSAGPADAFQGRLLSRRGNAPIEWVGSLAQGQPNITLTGMTFEEIEAKAKELDSGYTIFSNAASAGQPSLSSVRDVTCDEPNGRGEINTIRQGIFYLRGISGDCHMPPGPGPCSRVSCSWNSGIWYCNDRRDHLYVPCSRLGDYAELICDKPECRSHTGETKVTVRGQVYDGDNWTVIVGGENC